MSRCCLSSPIIQVHVLFVFPLVFLVFIKFPEPSNNIPPKKVVGAEFEGGWRVLNVFKQTNAWLSCQVTGYPVPRFK